ncbi:MAG: MlaD family protein [Solirubrobacteraceae bacterium]
MGSTVRAPRRARQSSRRTRNLPRRVIPSGLMVIGLVAAVITFALTAYNGIPLKGYRSLYLDAPAVGNLEQHDQVRIAGQRVGQVSSISITPAGLARVQLQIEPSTPALPVDSTSEIRAAGLLGARYIELIPGPSSRMLPSGSTLTIPLNAKTFGVPELLNTFNDPTLIELGNMPRGLGDGLLGNGTRLNAGLRSAAPAQVPFQQIVSVVLSRPGAVQALLPSANSALTPLDLSREQIGGLFAPTARAIAPFADRAQSVQSIFDQAPSALDAATTGLGRGQALLEATTALARAVNRTLPFAPAGLAAASRLLSVGPQTLPAADRLLRAVRPAVPAVLTITSHLSPTLAPLSQSLTSLEPLLQRIAQYGCDIANFGAVFRSMTGFASQGAPGGYGPAGQFRLQVIPSPAETLSTGTTAGDKSLAHFDPYPSPCQFTGPNSTTDPVQKLSAGLP